ncbi:MAG: hypothetical protein H8D23_32955, partial [Candidatus Brocadiales bacterium]|nr:hypothetical protein [Candidatus Brocadiales bacterium]
NHDRIFEEDPFLAKEIVDMYATNINYLQDSEVVIDGVKFYGSPWTPEFCGWAFALPKDDHKTSDERFAMIPDDVNVLISHGPAFGKLDQVDNLGSLGPNLGCPSLSRRIDEINPDIHICGHIHSGRGVIHSDGEVTTYINASCLGEDYQTVNGKNYIEWKINNDKF